MLEEEESLEDPIVTIDAHPSQDLLVAGALSGDLSVYYYNTDCFTTECSSTEAGPFLVKWTKSHKRSVRKARFSLDGNLIYTGTKNRALCLWDTETSKKVRCIREAHDAPVYSLCVCDANTVATGDEAGVVRVWDRRSTPEHGPIAEFGESTDYITDLAAKGDGKILLATCGDCTLSALNMKNSKREVQSETMHSELLSVAILNGYPQRVLCGSSDRHVEIFNGHEYGNIVERMDSGHKDTVDCLRVIGSNLVASASSSDGQIRILHFDPNHNLGVLGEHSEDGLEELAVTRCSKFLLSCGNDSQIKFWNVEEVAADIPLDHKNLKKKKINKNSKSKVDFFQDL